MSVERIIEPKRSFLKIDLKEIWKFRELFYIFAWRDIKVRYKQTALGVIWVILQPLISTFVFTVFFGRMAGVPSGDLPYPLFVLIGLVFWGFFSGSLNTASNSLVSNEHIIKKVYFPRIILPLAAIVTSSVDFLVNLTLLFILGLFFGFLPNLATIPLILLAIFFTATSAAGVSLFFAAFNVKYRDVRYVLPFIFQTLMFLTPVIYPLSIVSPRNQLLMAFNPMTSVIEIVRQIFSGNLNLNFTLIGISFISTIIFSFIGLHYFKKTEYQFADIA
jgi:lipopolysaccharide transport system permease protein